MFIYNKKIIYSFVIFFFIATQLIATRAFADVTITITPWKPVPPVIRRKYPKHLMLRRKCLIDLNVIPEDSSVFVDDVFRGKAWELTCHPKCLVLEPGKHFISVRREGFKNDNFVIHAKIHERINADVILNKKKVTKQKTVVQDVYLTNKGTAVFKVVPNDASLYIDNKFYGLVSKHAKNKDGLKLTEGIHHVKIVRPGYSEYDSTITISKNRLKIFHLELTKK